MSSENWHITPASVNLPNRKVQDDVFCGDQFTFKSLAAFLSYLVIFAIGGILAKYFIFLTSLYFAVVPPVVIVAFFIYKFKRQVFVEQVLYCALFSFCLSLPLVRIIPVIRRGWVYLVQLAEVSANGGPPAWVSTPAFLTWSIVDGFLLRAFLQEALKYVVVRRLLDRQQVLEHRSLIVYGLSAAMSLALVEAVRETIGVLYHVKLLQETERMTIDMKHALESNFLWSYIVYHVFYAFPMHAICAALIACRIARRKFTFDDVSCFQIIFFPILLSGFPSFVNRLIKVISRSHTARLMGSNTDITQLTGLQLRRLAASQFLYQVLSFIVMAICLLVAFSLTRYWYIKLGQVPAIDVHKYRAARKIPPPRFLISWTDFCNHEQVGEETSLIDENYEDGTECSGDHK